MNESDERIDRMEQLAARWCEATATEAEERELRDLLLGHDAAALPASLRRQRMLFEGLAAWGAEGCPERPGAWDAAPQALRRTAERTPEQPAARHATRYRTIQRRIGWGLAAAVAVSAAVTLTTVEWRRPYCYLNGEAIYDRETAVRMTACLRPLTQLEQPMELVNELFATMNKNLKNEE